MTSEIQEQLLDEFGGLFDGGTTNLEGFGSSDHDLTNPVADVAKQIEAMATGLTILSQAGVASETSSDGIGATDAAESLNGTVRALGQVTEVPPQSAATVAGTNTGGNGSNSTAESGNGGNGIGSIATTFLESGFGIVPLITGLIGLFGGGSETQPALEKYEMPSAVSFAGAETGSGLAAADFDQTGAPRVYSAETISPSAGSGAGAQPANAVGTTGGPVAPQITVNVQAMDAQSFMDHSGQIAQAVRSAMLNLSSLNDVVSDL